MKALILGATGHIGNAIVRELLCQGHQVTAISRRKEPPANLSELPISYLSGDIDTPGRLDAWVGGHEVVVDAAAPYPIYLFGATSASEKNSLTYATQRTRTLLDAIRKHEARLIYVSSFTTLLPRRQGFADWPAWLRQLHPYFAVKELIESHLLAAARGGAPIIIGNPTLCLGPWDMKAREFCFVPRVLSGEIPVAVQQIVNVIDVRDVAVGLVAALQAERYGEPILLSGHNIAADALQSWICEIGGRTPPRLSIPASLGVLPAYAMEAIQTLTGQPASFPALSVLLLCQHEWLAPSAAQQELGLVPRPLSETLLDTIQWYRELGYC
ncbi:MAG: NAD-dependent epimerase/dehydratase family protein [Deltaproteobacteria bacterium]|nr:NAD-dependent epimerase/dehydratase family protein [Deltaproteobacteria bacterium]